MLVGFSQLPISNTRTTLTVFSLAVLSHYSYLLISGNQSMAADAGWTEWAAGTKPPAKTGTAP